MVSAEPHLDEARACLARARAGEDVVAELAEHLGIVAVLPYSPGRYDVEQGLRLALFASADRGAVEKIVWAALPGGAGGSLRGLILREGDPLGLPMADNPWRIPATATLDEAITRVWGGVAEDVGRFVTELRRRLLGLALYDDDGEPLLAYLHFEDNGWPAGPRPPFDRRHALGWEPFGAVSAFVGYAPDLDPAPREGVPLPETLRDFYAVHAGLEGERWWLWAPGNVSPWSETIGDGTPEPVRDQDGQTRLSSDLLEFFSHGDERHDLFDLADDPDDLDDPPVRGWSRDGLDAGTGVRFWPWFDGNTGLFLGLGD